jgi:hypothetical protein
MENLMSILRIVGAAAILSAIFVAPASAGKKRMDPLDQLSQQNGCRYHQLGNPYTPEEDYVAWSAWRARGGWDDRSQGTCARVDQIRRKRPGYFYF